MTIIECPHGCGGFDDTSKGSQCHSCRRDMGTVDIMIPEDEEEVECPDGIGYCYPQSDGCGGGMILRKPSWCWEWHGPTDNRWRCRRAKGHDGEHDSHEDGSWQAEIRIYNELKVEIERLESELAEAKSKWGEMEIERLVRLRERRYEHEANTRADAAEADRKALERVMEKREKWWSEKFMESVREFVEKASE